MKIVRKLALTAALLAAIPASQAAVQTFAVTGQIDSGYYMGQLYSGSFSFDDAPLSNSGQEWLAIDSLSLNFLGTTWTLSNEEATTEAAYLDGNFLGLSYSASNPVVAFSFVPGFDQLNQAYLAYDTTLGTSGAGSAIMTPVPESSAWAMALAGLALLGFLRRRG